MHNLFFLLSIDNSIVSTLYLFLVFIFLIPIFLLINSQLLRLIFSFINFKRILVSRKISNKDVLSIDQILTLANIYIQRKQWFECILLLESEIEHDVDNLYYYNLTGYCYYSMNLNDLAKLYYLKALALSPSSVMILINLAKVYHLLEEFDNAVDTYRQILFFDKNNKIAKKYLSI